MAKRKRLESSKLTKDQEKSLISWVEDNHNDIDRLGYVTVHIDEIWLKTISREHELEISWGIASLIAEKLNSENELSKLIPKVYLDLGFTEEISVTPDAVQSSGLVAPLTIYLCKRETDTHYWPEESYIKPLDDFEILDGDILLTQKLKVSRSWEESLRGEEFSASIITEAFPVQLTE